MKNSGLTDGERLVRLETKVDAIIETQKTTSTELQKLTQLFNDLMPTYATKHELNTYSQNNEKRIENLKKANKLQVILTNILVSGLSVILTTLSIFWFDHQ